MKRFIFFFFLFSMLVTLLSQPMPKKQGKFSLTIVAFGLNTLISEDSEFVNLEADFEADFFSPFHPHSLVLEEADTLELYAHVIRVTTFQNSGRILIYLHSDLPPPVNPIS